MLRESAKVLENAAQAFQKLIAAGMRKTVEIVNFAARALADIVFGMREVEKDCQARK